MGCLHGFLQAYSRSSNASEVVFAHTGSRDRFFCPFLFSCLYEAGLWPDFFEGLGNPRLFRHFCPGCELCHLVYVCQKNRKQQNGHIRKYPADFHRDFCQPAYRRENRALAGSRRVDHFVRRLFGEVGIPLFFRQGKLKDKAPLAPTKNFVDLGCHLHVFQAFLERLPEESQRTFTAAPAV